ncbi:TPA: phage tail spike protein [Streptococcus suis]
MIYLFDKDEKLIKIVRKSAVKTALQKYALTTERYVSDRLTVELKGLNADELEQVEYMAIQTMEDAHTFHYFYVAQKFSDELTTLIGVQSGIEELRKSPVFDKRPKNALARDVITDLLAGTNWQARFVGETAPHSTNFYYTSVFDALKKVCVVWDLEMQFFVEMNGNRIGARYIDFKQRIGEAVGKRVVYGHNALQILQEVERTNIFTALVGRGKGEETGDGYGRKITFENVVWSRTQGKPVDKPKGQKYLELPLMTRQYGIRNADGSMRPKIGFVDFSEEENPEILIERTYKALVDAARPQLTLKTSSVYLRGVKVGDTIRVVRHDKKLDYDTRIFEITFNRLNNQSSDIKLGDRIGESNEAKVQTIADKAVEQFITNEFSNFVQNLPDYLPSADGFNNNWYGTEDPTVKYPGKVLINDIWFKPDPEHEGHKIMLRWTGEVWEEILRTYESESLRDRIAEEIAQVNQSMQAQSEEHDRQVANILSKTQSVESLANQAKADAASALARANQVKTEAIADARAQVATVSQALNTAKAELQSAIASADQKARDSQASATALRNDLNSQANKILAQAQAQTALTNRLTTVETLADGTRSTVADLSRTMNEATQTIASVTNRTRMVEDTLSQTRTQYEVLTQTVNAQTGQIDSINRKTADLQSGIDGVTERFESLQIGGRNYFRGYNHNEEIALPTYNGVGSFIQIYDKLTFPLPEADGKIFTISFEAISPNGDTVLQVYNSNGNPRYFYFNAGSIGTATNAWKKFKTIVNPITQTTFTASTKSNRLEIHAPSKTGVKVRNIKVELGTVATDWSPDEEDLRSEIATYKRTAEESSAELSRQIQLADGKAIEAKTYAQQTAEVLKTRLESLETYKNEEGTRAEQYLSASRTETAKQITAERTAIANNYVAKSTYDENVRGTTLKLNEIKTTADTAKQNLATYQNTVDRKLEELTSSTQTLDGKINTASAKVDTVAGQIRTEISEVEGKIPTEVGGRNYLRNSRKIIRSQQRFIEVLTWEVLAGLVGKTVTFSFDIKVNPGGVSRPISVYRYQNNGISPALSSTVTPTSEWQRFSLSGIVKSDIVNSTYTKGGISFYDWAGNNDYSIQLLKIELGTIATDWTPAPEDFDTELSSVKTTITQTASGVEQLSTSLSATNTKVTTAETNIRQLVNDVSSKVSQSDYNTLTGRMTSAETAITQNATEISKRLTSTQVESAITGKGYQTKAQVDNNITGRGYITSSALQPYALSTTVQNLVQETATSFSRTISETKAMIPTEAGGRNYILGSRSVPVLSNNTQTCPISTEQLKDGSREFIRIRRSNPSLNPSLISLYTEIRGFSSEMPTSGKGKISFKARASAPVNMNVMGILISSTSTNLPWDRSQIFIGTEWKTYSFDFEFVKGMTILRANPLQILPPVPNLAEFYLDLCEWQLEAGSMTSSWSLATEDLATVTALHDVKDTVTSHTRTISTINGTVSTLVQTANGLVTEVSGTNGLKTQVSQLAGSWAVKNLTSSGNVLNQLNLNKDGSVKIDGKLVQITGTTYIQDGVITSAKIAGLDAGKINTGELNAARIKANSIDGSKIVFDQAFLNKMIANEAYLQQLFAKSAFITQVQAVRLSASKISGGILTATNRAMEINLNAGQILYYTDQAALKRVLSGYPTQFVKFATGYVASKGQAGVTVIGSNRWNSESSNDGGFVGIRAWNGTDIDQIDVVGDTVRLASSAFEAADGWSINTLPGKLDIDAFNADHRASSKIKVGDLWLWKNASTYSSMKGTINLIIDNLQLLHSNKSTERAYSYTLPAKV